MKTFFIELFEYNFQSNDQLIERALAFEPKITERSSKWFSHILNAHEIWNSRMLNQKPEFGVWQTHAIEDWKAINQSKFEASLSIIDEYGFDFLVNYSNSKGKSFQNTIRDILFHIINHSTYHRGQIATDFRENDIEPIFSDYIFFKR